MYNVSWKISHNFMYSVKREAYDYTSNLQIKIVL